MQITKLGLLNFKGRTAEHSFQRCNLIVARNATGKTAIMDAVRLAFMGETISAIDGKSIKGKAGIESFASDYPMRVDLCMNGPGGNFVQSFALEKAGRTTKLDHKSPDWMDERTRLLLDPDQFFGATGPERSKFLARCLSDSKLSDAEIAAKLRAIKMPTASIAPGILDETIAKLMPVLSKHELLSAKTEAAITFLGETKNESAAVQKRLLNMAIGLTDLAAVETALADIPQLTAIDGRLVLLRRQLEDATGERARLEQAQKSIAGNRDTLAALEALAGRDFAADKAALEKQIGSLDEAIANAIPDLEAKKKAVVVLSDQHKGIANKIAKIEERITMITAEATGTEGEWQTGEVAFPADAAELEVEALIAVPAAWDKTTKTLQWREIKRWRIAPVKLSDEDAARIETAESELQKQQMQAMELAVQIEEAQRLVEDTEGPIEQTKGMRAGIAQKLADTEKQIVAQGESQTQIQTLRQSLQSAVEAPESKDAGIAKLRQDIAASDAMRDKRAGLEQDRKRIGDSQAESAKCEVEIEILTAMLKQAKTINADSAGSGMDGALVIANRFCDGVLKTPLCFRDGSIGRMERGLFVDASTFSGSEAVLCRLAICVALASKAAFRIVLLDELSIFDLENKERLVANITALAGEDLVDQVFISDNDTEFWRDSQSAALNLVTI